MADEKPDILIWPYRRFREFLNSGDWSALPSAIQKALLRLWRAEQDVERVHRKRTRKE
jgi:hypothetical protein